MPCHHIREYRYAYGAVEPLTGDGYFLVMPYCNTVCMNIFSEYLRLTAWGIFINFLGENGPISEKFDQYDVEESTQVESLCEIRKQGKSIVVSIQSTEKISYPILSASQTTVTNTVVSFDGKQMQPELEAKAEVTFKGTKGSSTFQNVGTCLWDIASYKANDPVQWSEFIHIDTDGSMDDTRKAPAFNNRVAMQHSGV